MNPLNFTSTAESLGTTKISTVIFDCDGVLVDTESLKYAAWRDALSYYNINLTIDDYLPLVGHSSNKIASEIEQAAGREFDKNELIKRKGNLYKIRQAQNVQPIPKAVSFLKSLLENKGKYPIKVALASSAPHQEIITNLENIGVAPKDFDAIMSGHDDLKNIIDPEEVNKPKPYIYLETARILKVNPRNCIVFEDTNAGIEAATSAGMIAIAVPNEYTQNQDFQKSSEIISFEKFSIMQFEREYLKINRGVTNDNK